MKVQNLFIKAIVLTGLLFSISSLLFGDFTEASAKVTSQQLIKAEVKWSPWDKGTWRTVHTKGQWIIEDANGFPKLDKDFGTVYLELDTTLPENWVGGGGKKYSKNDISISSISANSWFTIADNENLLTQNNAISNVRVNPITGKLGLDVTSGFNPDTKEHFGVLSKIKENDKECWQYDFYFALNWEAELKNNKVVDTKTQKDQFLPVSEIQRELWIPVTTGILPNSK